jgi:hypothetical protein
MPSFALDYFETLLLSMKRIAPNYQSKFSCGTPYHSSVSFICVEVEAA